MKRTFFMCSLLITVSMATFCVPIIININNNNTAFDKLLFIPMLVILVNMIPFVFFSEAAKYSCSISHETHKNKRMYNFLSEYNRNMFIVIIYSILTTAALSLTYFVIYGKHHIKGIILYNVCVAISYVAGCFVFNCSVRDGFIYRKGDYFFFRSYLLISLPLCSAIYLVELLNNQLENITLLVLICVSTIVYAVLTHKKVLNSKRKYTTIIVCMMVGLIILFLIFGTNNDTVLRNMVNTMLFSLEFAVYSYLLTSLIYSNVSPNKSEEDKHSIEKLQVSLFNFAPVFSITLLIELMDSPKIIFFYASINIVAIMLVGKKKGTINTITVIALLIGFIVLSIFTFSHKINYTLNLRSPITWISPVATIWGMLKSVVLVKNEKEKQRKVQKYKRLNFLRPNMAYYTTALSSNLILSIITTIIEITPNTYNDDFSKNQVIIYIAVTFLITIARAYYAYANYKDAEEIQN